MLDNIPGVYDTDELEQRSAVLTEKAQAVAEELRVRVPDTEKARRLPVENMERICDEGLLTVIQSRRCGGHELSMRKRRRRLQLFDLGHRVRALESLHLRERVRRLRGGPAL